MTRVLIALALVAALPHVPRAQTPPNPAGTIRLDVVALDRKGVPVTDLRPSEFEVWISGYRVPIEDVYAPPSSPGGRTIILLLDDMAVGPAFAFRVKEAARHFVNKMAPGDRIAVVPVRGGRMALTDDRAQLRQSIEGYYRTAPMFRPDDGSRQVLTLLTALCKQMAETIQGRKTIVAIGAAWLFDTPLPPPSLNDLNTQWIDTMRMMSATNASLYVIDPAGLGAVGGAARYGGKSGFAHETGGYAFLNTNDLEGAAARILAEAGSYYVLSMPNPPVQRTAALREVEVKILRKDVTVRVRGGIRGRP